ncbi:TY-Chap domain-containing protein [Knoellia subterranea]|uniref:TY-Chap N-terminal domain-containing protein n=1 Tax=Knoellia subterranea KCTC 19937 TaxID=1385521 RepID=A0A0A0JU51_9MICO|nr:hypothetical protein [Knoellia subterranea]KGN39592.1 hypothetical protein N803_01890 [Knoellia subterranea KCTC 19937]
MTYAVELPAAGPADWAAWSGELVHRIRALDDGDDVLVSIPELARPHMLRHSRIFGLVPAHHEDTHPWVRIRRDEDHAILELVGSENFGGEYLLSKEDEDAIDALGWRRPGHDDIEARVWSRWYPDDVTDTAYLPLAQARAAADLVTRTLRDVLCEERND